MTGNVRRNLAVTLTAGGTNPLKMRLQGTLPYTDGVAVSAALVGQGGTKPYAYSITAGALPTGLSLNSSTGLITGTPSAVGAFTFTAQVQDATATVYNASSTMNIGHVLKSVNGTPLIIEAGLAYSNQLHVINATGTVSWALTSGSLPTSVTLSAGGLLSGTYPGAALTFNFVITATDSGTGDALPISLSAITLDGLNLAAGGMPDCTGTVPYIDDQYVNTTTGGLHPLTFSAVGLPTGLAINSVTGQITGTATAAAGLYAATVNVTDALGAVSTRSTNVAIYNPTVIQPQAAGANVGAKGASNMNFDGIGAANVTNDGTTMTTTLGVTMNAPPGDVTIPANCSATVHRKFTIAAGKKLTIGAGAIFRID